MNQITPSQSPQGALVKSWCRFSKTGFLAAVLATAVVPVASARVDSYGTLTVQPLGILDVQNNNVIVLSGVVGTATAGVYNGLTRSLQTGINSPNLTWDGPGINSSVAAAGSGITAVGIADNSILGYTTWPPLDPRPVAANSILIKYTYYGDADLSGVVTTDDYLFFLDGLAVLAPPAWLNGDFDYSGTVTTDDYLFLLSGLGATPPLVSQGGVSAVPEPTSVGLLFAGMLSFLARRRRS